MRGSLYFRGYRNMDPLVEGRAKQAYEDAQAALKEAQNLSKRIEYERTARYYDRLTALIREGAEAEARKEKEGPKWPVPQPFRAQPRMTRMPGVPLDPRNDEAPSRSFNGFYGVNPEEVAAFGSYPSYFWWSPSRPRGPGLAEPPERPHQ